MKIEYTEEELQRMHLAFIKILQNAQCVYIPYIPLMVIPYEKIQKEK